MSEYFAYTGAPVALNLPSLGPSKSFAVRPMSQADYEQVGIELFRHNIVPISQATFRAHFIEELFQQFPEAEAETKADLLDAYWQAEDLYNDAAADWSMQEEQRLLDMQNGAPMRVAAPRPVHTMCVRDRARATALADEVRTKSRKLRDLNIEMQTYQRRQREGMVRVVLCGWSGFATPYAQDETFTITTEEAWSALKREIGPETIKVLMDSVMAGELVDGTERGNSDSPPDMPSDPTGSPSPSGASEISDGTSTELSITPVQPEGSGVTTTLSSPSTTYYGGNSQSSEPLPTVDL